MAVRVTPTEKQPTHDISLSNGTDTLGLILCNGKGEHDPKGIKQSGYPRSVTRISQNVAGYSDFELPYSPQVQSDFSGGRALEDLEKDTTRFFDSYRCDTTRGDATCGPLATSTMKSFSTGTAIGEQSLNNFNTIGTNYTPSESFTLRSIRTGIDVTSLSSGVADLTVLIYSDASGHPDAILATGKTYVFTATANDLFIDFEVTLALTAGTQYWIVFQWVTGGFKVDTASATGKKLVYVTGSYDTLADNTTFAMTLRGFGFGELKFFEFRGTLFALSHPSDMSASRLWMNGYRGMAAANTGALQLTKTSLTLTASELVGKVVKIVAGPGSKEDVPWRTIIAHTTGADAELTVSPPWNVTHSTATEFVILGCNNWSLVTVSPALVDPVTDVCIVDDMVFFAQGESSNILRGKLTNNTWAFYYEGSNATDASGNKASFLKYITDTQGKKRVWRALATAATVSYAEKPTWSASNTTTLTFKTSLVCGSTDSKITGIEEYGTPQTLYVLKETGFGSIGGTTDKKVGVYAEHPLSSQIRNVRSEDNGRAHMRYDLYLIFSLLDGIESHYDQRLDDVGPNREEGLPIGRKGPVYNMVPYAGRYYACVDGGKDGYSSILCCTRDGSWHEVYRSALGARVRSMYIQVIPGDVADRLWFSEDEDAVWLPLAIDPRKQADYAYFSGAQVITSSIYCGFKDVVKYFHELTIFAENLSTTHQYITAEYQTDSEIGTTTWHALATNFTTSPSQTIRMSATNNVHGRRIRLRFTLYTDDTTKTPRIKAYRLDSVIRLKPKKMWSVTYMVKDNQVDLTKREQSGLTLSGVAATWTPENVLTLLDNFADSDVNSDPLTMRTLNTYNDNQLVFIEPTSISPLSEVTTPNRERVLMGSFTLLQA